MTTATARGPGRPAKPSGEFGLALEAARRARKFTQAQAAELLGVDTDTLSRWERGLTLPTELLREAALRRLKGARKC